MKFRATIENVPTFYRLVQAIEKLQKKCIIKFSEEDIRVICNDDANEGGIQVWSQIKIPSIFTAYRIQSNSGNQITMCIPSEALISALRSSNPVTTSNSSYETEDVVVKLAKKNDHAVLTFEILGTTGAGRRVKVEHDVKVEVMKASDVARLREPMCPEPDVHIVLPPLSKLRTILERLRPMSDLLSIRANNAGTLKLSIRTEAVSVETEWHGCQNPRDSVAQEDGEHREEDEEDRNQSFNVLVSIRSFHKFLNSHVVSHTTIACICENHCIILYVYVGDVADAGGVLTFYIPAILDN